MNSEFSIVIPVRNRPKLIIRALESVKRQSYRPLRVIVVDNASTDTTQESITNWIKNNNSDNFCLELLEESKPGAAAARNRGLAAVNSEWMMFFDSDDEMKSDLVRNAVEAFEKNPGVEMVYWKCEIMQNAKIVKIRKYTESDHWRAHIYNAQFCTQCFAIKTEFIKNIDGWKEELKTWDDWELGIRILLEQPPKKGIPKILTTIHPQTESITGINYFSKAGDWEKAIDASQKDIERSELPNKLKNNLLDMINYRRINLCALYRREGHSEKTIELRQKAKENLRGNKLKWLWLRILEYYTALGGRGAYLMWK